MPQSGSDSVLGNLLSRRHKLSAARQKLGLEAPRRAGIQGNLRGAGVPSRTPTQPGTPTKPTTPARPVTAASTPAKPAAPQTALAPAPGANVQATGMPIDKREKMLTRAREFLGLLQYVNNRPQPRPELAVPGRSRQMLAGGF